MRAVPGREHGGRLRAASPQPVLVVIEPGELQYDQARVYLKRYKEARVAGLTVVEARLWAESEEDVRILRLCVKAQCPVEYLPRIVL